ncbi:hypothetical protein [Paenibacillus cremeus]|nr:hypothetical protein [Paenibacillus cremeus]
MECVALFFRRKLGMYFYYDDPDKFICSEELAKAMYDVTGKFMNIKDKTPTFDLSPQDLWESEYLVEIEG